LSFANIKTEDPIFLAVYRRTELGLVTVPGTRCHSREELLHAPAGMIHLLATEKFSKKENNRNNKKPVQGNTEPQGGWQGKIVTRTI